MSKIIKINYTIEIHSTDNLLKKGLEHRTKELEDEIEKIFTNKFIDFIYDNSSKEADILNSRIKSNAEVYVR